MNIIQRFLTMGNKTSCFHGYTRDWLNLALTVNFLSIHPSIHWLSIPLILWGIARGREPIWHWANVNSTQKGSGRPWGSRTSLVWGDCTNVPPWSGQNVHSFSKFGSAAFYFSFIYSILPFAQTTGTRWFPLPHKGIWDYQLCSLWPPLANAIRNL